MAKYYVSTKNDNNHTFLPRRNKDHTPVQAGSMLAGVLYNTFGMRGMFLVVGVGLSSIALCYLFLYHVALKRLKTDNICKS